MKYIMNDDFWFSDLHCIASSPAAGNTAGPIDGATDPHRLSMPGYHPLVLFDRVRNKGAHSTGHRVLYLPTLPSV